MDDGSWAVVRVLSQAPQRGGGWRVHLEWHARGTWTGWFLVRGAAARAQFREVRE